MEENEIELWEEKSKSGMLRGDSVISSALSKMRQNWYTPVETGGAFTQLADIGIKTSSNYLDRGKLEITEADLRKALQEDPSSVRQLFAGTEEKPGIARRLEATMTEAVKSIESKAGKPTSLDNNFLLGRQIKDINEEMTDFEDRLTSIEDRYWRQFGAMESAIQKMNSQSAYIMQNFFN